MFRRFIIFIIVLIQVHSLSGQCPDRAFLWNRIIYLRDSSQRSSKEQLNELKNYLNKINSCSYQYDSTHVLLLSRIGWLYSKEHDLTSAIACTNRAIDIIHTHINEKNTRESQLIKCYNNLRILYDSANQVPLRNKAIDSCISVESA